MKAFEFANPDSIVGALNALKAKDSVALAGGTDLINRMKDYIDSPARVVDIKNIKDLAGISGTADAGLVIGANTRLVDLINSDVIKTSYPGLHQAAEDIGTPQIRNMATVGGNLLQRPRCWYYRNGFGILGLKDGKSLARAGDNRYHAIFDTESDALYVNPSSLATVLTALGAKATIKGAAGERVVSIPDLYQIPKSNNDSELTVAAGELLTQVTIPGKPGKSATYSVRGRLGDDWPLVMASAHIKGNDAIVVLYGVAATPYISKAASEAIAGKAITMESAEAAAAAAAKGAKPLSMNGYKVSLVKTAVKRALLTITGERYWEKG